MQQRAAAGWADGQHYWPGICLHWGWVWTNAFRRHCSLSIIVTARADTAVGFFVFRSAAFCVVVVEASTARYSNVPPLRLPAATILANRRTALGELAICFLRRCVCPVF